VSLGGINSKITAAAAGLALRLPATGKPITTG
jgi:hypothetical protein